MKKRRSILEEIDTLIPTRDKDSIIESRANHIITSAINLINLIHETYDPTLAKDLERRLLNSIRGQDSKKFSRGIKRIQEDKENED